MLAFEKYAPEMQKLWDTMKIIRDATQLDAMAKKVLPHKDVYKKVAKEIGPTFPWQMVAVIHIREAGLGDVGRWQGGIHNGQYWGKKATIEPKIGPFKSWHECAVYSLKLKGFHNITAWPPGMQCAALEPYNGYGYRGMGLRTPYVWASTNHQQRGKYVRDHVFDASVMDTQLGCAAMLRFLGIPATSTPVKTVVKDVVGVGTPTGTFSYLFPEYIIPIAIFGAIVLGTIWMYRYFKNKDKVNVQ